MQYSSYSTIFQAVIDKNEHFPLSEQLKILVSYMNLFNFYFVFAFKFFCFLFFINIIHLLWIHALVFSCVFFVCVYVCV